MRHPELVKGLVRYQYGFSRFPLRYIPDRAGADAIGAYIGGTIADHLGYVLLMSMYGAMALLSLIPLLWVKKE